MGRPNFLAGLKAAKDTLFTPDFGKEIAELEAKLSALQDQHGRLVLDARRDLPGSSDKLGRAVDELQATRAALNDAKAAQRAQEAEEGANQAKEAAQAAERQDKASQAACDQRTAKAAKLQDAIGALVEAWDELLDAQSECQAQFAQNPRVRDDLAIFSLPDAVSREIARQARAKIGANKPLPPGANQMALTTGDPRTWPSLREVFADMAKAVFRQRP